MDIVFKPGDFFASDSVSDFGRLTRNVERIWSKDNKARCSHAGIIVNTSGGTVESKSTVREGNISDYIGHNLIIGRWQGMDPENFQAGLDAIKWNMGKIYPAWRLPLFLIPALAKLNMWGGLGVCSELVAKFLIGAGLASIGSWRGQNPDDIADMIQNWRDIEIVFNGTITE